MKYLPTTITFMLASLSGFAQNVTELNKTLVADSVQKKMFEHVALRNLDLPLYMLKLNH